MESVDLTQGKVTKVLLALAVPIMGSSLLQFTYNLVDMFWVGHLGSDCVASIGSSSFFIGLGYAINALVMIGTGIKVAKHIGKGDLEKSKDYIHSGMQLNLLLWMIYALVLIGLGSVFISFLGLKNPAVEKGAYSYLMWSVPVLGFGFFNNLFSRVFASLGNSKVGLRISAVGIILNIILDPILIYGLKWGVVGAAIATLIANGVMFILYFMIGRDFFCFNPKRSMNKHQINEIIRLGMPIAFQRILFSVINIFLAKLIAIFGSDAVAAQKIGVQIESVTYMVTGGLNGAVASFIGQNYGAKKKERLYEGYASAIKIAIIYATLTSIVFWVFPFQIVSLFVDEVDTINIAISYLRIIAYSQIFNGIEMVSAGFFTGIGKPKIPSIISIIFTALRLPIAFITMNYLGVEGIWWSITFSTFLKGSVLLGIYFIT